MDKNEFEEAFRRLVERARSSEKIPLEELIGSIESDLEGLKMAEAEGEQF